MSGRAFVEKWVYDGRTGAVERELDVVRSEYPHSLDVGYHKYAVGSTGSRILLTVPEGKYFNLKMVHVYNGDASADATLWLYDGESVPAMCIPVPPLSERTVNGLAGVVFQTAVRASTNTSLVFVRVGGFIYDSE